ncbi:MAG: hypothetical protein H6733_13400 [Alphaproteobacteria bacterium]|nr:hypothetical protein [Alphaproteobacteria bacterium]
MRRVLVPALLLVAVGGPITAVATGFGGSDAPSRVPVPARDFAATVEDLSGNVVELRKVSFDGEVFVYGRIGEGHAAVPFERIAEVRVEPTSDKDKRVAFIKLTDGTSVKVMVDDDVPCWGVAPWGNYKIAADDIRRVTFHH